MPRQIFSRSLDPEKPYRTPNINFSSALLADDQLDYVGTEIVDGEQVFVFDDPLGVAPELLKRYQNSVYPKLNPRLLFEARGFLVGEVSTAKKFAGRSGDAASK